MLELKGVLSRSAQLLDDEDPENDVSSKVKGLDTSGTDGKTVINTTTTGVAIDLSGVDISLVRLSVTEGKYRMVRRILHNAGHTVLALHRLEYGCVELGDLPSGAVRSCTSVEAAWARNLLR